MLTRLKAAAAPAALAALTCLVQALLLLLCCTSIDAAAIKVQFYKPLPTIPRQNLVRRHYGGMRAWPKDAVDWPKSNFNPLRLTMLPADIIVDPPADSRAPYTDTASGPVVMFTQPVYKADGFPLQLYGPAAVVASGVPFRITLTNKLPFQPSIVCSDPNFPEGATDPSQLNGFKEPMWTNLHTHGMRVDPGAVSVQDSCQAQAVDEGVSAEQYYCDADAHLADGSDTFECAVFGDNVFVSDRPSSTSTVTSNKQGFNSRLTYTYPIPKHAPGTHWYHTHLHGSVGYQTPTSNGPLQVAESTIPGGLDALFKQIGGPKSPRDLCLAACYEDLSYACSQQHPDKAALQACVDACPGDCDTLKEILADQPNTKAPILIFEGLWLRNVTGPTGVQQPDDDSLFFIGCNSSPSSPLLCPDANTTDPDRAYDTLKGVNKPGMDWMLINGVMQPDIRITAGRYQRLQMLSTFTMKWMDVTVWKLPDNPAGLPAVNELATPADCSFLLLGKDGVPLLETPRLLRSQGRVVGGPPAPAGTSGLSDVLLYPAERADVLLRCNTPGNYVLVSGKGPFTRATDCGAVHCELFGDTPGNPDVVQTTANNFYRGKQYDAAILATLTVKPPTSCAARYPRPGYVDKKYDSATSDLAARLWNGLISYSDPLITGPVCSSRLEQFPYLDTASFPKRQVQQCFTYNNQNAGAACNINGCEFGQLEVCIEQGTTQIWNVRDITFHPHHLHETPIQAVQVPACATQASNYHQVGDWHDTWQLPMCDGAVGCTGPEPSQSPSNLACDQLTTRFRASVFTNINKTPLQRTLLQQQQLRYSVFHCHILTHEDEGCMAIVRWDLACAAEEIVSDCSLRCAPPGP